MTLPNDELRTLLDTVRELYKKSGVTQTQFALDAGVSVSTMSLILNYTKYRPGRYVEQQLRAFVKKLRQRCPQKVNQEA